MACVPPRAGFESARKLPIARRNPLSRYKMKQLLARSSMWHRMYRGWPPALNVRNVVSQAVVVDEMEAIEASEPIEKKAAYRQRWQAHETMALIAAKKQQDLMGMESPEAAGIEIKKTKNKWKEVEAFCRERGVERSAQQCQTRWSRLLSAFTQIKSWEESRKPEQQSFWSLKLDERKTMGFLVSIDQRTYNALDEILNTKTGGIEHVLIGDNVLEVADYGSVNLTPHGDDRKKYNTFEVDVNFSPVQGKSAEMKNLTSLQSSSYKSDEMVHTKGHSISKPNVGESSERDIIDAGDNFYLEKLEGCSHENNVDQCKARKNTKILSEFLEMAMDDRSDGQVPHVSTGKTDIKPMLLPASQQVEELKVSGISDPLILCDQEDVHVEAQLLPAREKRSDNSNKESCKVPLVVEDKTDKAQLLHAGAENVDCILSNLRTGQHAEPLEYFENGEQIILRSRCNQRDAYDEMEFQPASVEMMIDGSDKDSYKGSLEADGAEEKPIVMDGNGDNVSSSSVMNVGIAHSALDKCIGKGAFKTSASVLDSLAEEGIASVSEAVEEPCKCQRSESHLSSPGVDVLNAKQGTQTTPLSHVSADKEDCQNYSVNRILVGEAWVSKNAHGEGNEVDSFLCSRNVEEVTTTSADSSQSKFFEAQNKNVPCQMFEHQQKLDPVLNVKEEITTGVSQPWPQNKSTFSTSQNIESSLGVQDNEIEKSEVGLLEEGHIEMIADLTERNATLLECGTGQSSEEKKAEHVENGKNLFSLKTGGPSESIKHVEVAIKDTYTKWGHQMQSDHEKDGNDAFERPEVAPKEGDWLGGVRASTVNTKQPALTSCDHQVQHLPKQKGTITGNAGSLESESEASRVKVVATEQTKLEFIVKNDTGTPVTDEKGSIEDGSQKTSVRSLADDDVFVNIPAATGSLVKSALQTIRKFFKF